MKFNGKKLVAAAVAAAVIVVSGADSAMARWGSSSSGSYGGSSGSSGSHGGGSSGGWSGSSGSSSGGSWGGHHQHRRWAGSSSSGAYSGSSSSSSWSGSSSSGGYSVGYSASSGGYSGYYSASSGGYSGYSSWGASSGGSSGGAYYESTPVIEGTEIQTVPSQSIPSNEQPGTVVPEAPKTSARIEVKVPADAKIYVNGIQTKMTGDARRFVSRGLEAGRQYEYSVRAEVIRDGKVVSETKEVTLAAGAAADLSFNLDGEKTERVVEQPKDSPNASTKVTLHVPASAKVYLAGRETKSTGEVREFTTNRLSMGAEWEGYTVKVVAAVNGQQIEKSETITLRGGEDRELNFNFDTVAVARR